MNNYKAILIVSFGTSYDLARQKAIDVFEDDIKKEFNDYDVVQGFTSAAVVKILRKRNIYIDTIKEALDRLCTKGYREVIVQPTHIMKGFEYEKVVKAALEYSDKFECLKVGLPLLSDVHKISMAADVILQQYGNRDKEDVLVFMGHGTAHQENIVYEKLQTMFIERGYTNIFIGTVEGEPDFADTVQRIKEYKPSKIYLAPLMLVAGDHAMNDMAGENEGSWNRELINMGFETECIIKGLGEIPLIRKIYIDHIKEMIS